MTADLDFKNAPRLGLFQVFFGGRRRSGRGRHVVVVERVRSARHPVVHRIPPRLRLLAAPPARAWIAVATVIGQRGGGEVWAYFSGWAVIFSLLALALGANVLPWLRLCVLQLSA